jgi:hypothetical protein
MKRLALFLAATVFPLAAVAAEPEVTTIGPDGAQWVWCKPDARGRAGAGAPERAELVISGTSVFGRLLVNDREYATIEGVIKPASNNIGSSGETRVWEIAATETRTDKSAAGGKIALKGSYTKYQSAEAASKAHAGSYEMLALSTPGEDGAPVIISRVQPASPLQFAAR